MYGKKVKILSSIRIHDKPLEHIKHGTYVCHNAWCLRNLCECDDDHSDYDDCPFIKQKINHEHDKKCPECDRLVLKETMRLFRKALRMSEK